jgi:hypothetical protein
MTKAAILIVLVAWALGAIACGGASKPPMQPDSDNATLAGDGGPDMTPAAPAPPAAAPAHS